MAKQVLALKKPNFHPKYFLNRELSWLEFNARVLEEALLPSNPLLERIKFLAIFSSNLDGFFMVRVAGLKKMQKEGFLYCESPDNMTVLTALKRIREKTLDLIELSQNELQHQILPKLLPHGIEILKHANLSTKQKQAMDKYFTELIFPILTPLAIDSSHPVPFLANLALYWVIEFETSNSANDSKEPLIGFVEIPAILSRLIPLVKDKNTQEFTFLMLEDLIAAHFDQLFLGFKIKNFTLIRVTRNLDYTLLENNIVDLLESVQKEVHDREHQEAVRLEIWQDIPISVLNKLTSLLQLDKNDIYHHPCFLNFPGLSKLADLPLEELKDVPFNPRIPARLASPHSMFTLIKEKDLLVHHPYESFYAVVEFIQEAANDPDVLAIKQTLYRLSDDSPIVDALIKACANGKHVTVVVELKARFDEKNNIYWAQRLEKSGVNVVYGIVGFKIHSKVCLVIRQEKGKIVRYVHLSTGNYNHHTAKQYTDIGLFTAWDDLGKDISSLFNLLTGFNILSKKSSFKRENIFPKFDTIYVSPLYLRDKIISEIVQVIQAQKNIMKSDKSSKTLIAAKLNGLVDADIINHLYLASQAGVQVKLIVRGICCLKPGIKDLSENIEVISIVDRFLEHSRVYIFQTPKEQRVFLGSADWMVRSMDHRVEILYPVIDKDIKERLINEVFFLAWNDEVKARVLQKDGTYVPRIPSKKKNPFRSQQKFIELARLEGIKSIPYEKAIRYDVRKKRGQRPVAKSKDKKKHDEN